MVEAKSQRSMTLERICTLLCLMIISIAEYGLRVCLLCGTAIAVSMLTEILCLRVRRKPLSLSHLEAAAIGLLVTLMMPATVSYSVIIISCIFAIIIGRQIFGGSDNPVFPAASVGYVFAQLTWRLEVLSVPRVFGVLPLGSCADVLKTESASHMWNVSGTITGDYMDWLTGTEMLPMGSQSILLLLVIAIVLCVRRSSAACTAVSMVVMSVLLGLVSSYWKTPEGVMVCSAMMNLTLFSAIYLLGDPMTAPKGLFGVIYGAIAGLLSVYLTRMLHIQNAPVMLSIILQPLAICFHTVYSRYFDCPVRTEKGRCAE